MSGAYVSATVDIGDVEQGLEAMQRRAHQLGPAFVEVKAAMKVDQREHREAQSGPEGKWPGRAASTLAAAKHRKKKLPRKILGKLPTAIAYKALPFAAIGESRVRWSQIHQDGGHVGRGHRALLPARPFLWISDKLLRATESILERVLLAAWGGAR